MTYRCKGCGKKWLQWPSGMLIQITGDRRVCCTRFHLGDRPISG